MNNKNAKQGDFKGRNQRRRGRQKERMKGR
jgi:hypothetical protein